MNKQELEAENRRLTDENGALRELLGAVSVIAGTVPVAKDGGWLPEWKRSTRVLANIKHLSRLPGGWDGEIAYATEELRAIAAEPVGYEVYVEPEPPAAAEPHECLPEGWCCGAFRTRAAVTAPEPPAVVAEDEPEPNPPHHVVGAEPCCRADGWDDRASGYVCTAQAGHDGPDHVAYEPGGGEYHRWPVAASAPAIAPLSVTA